MKKKLYVERYGCSRRLIELSNIKEYFIVNGYESVDSPEKADLVCIGTCAFKEKEESHSINKIREMKKKSKNELFVYGCLPDISPTKYNEFSDVKKLAPKELHLIDNYFENQVKFNQIDTLKTHKPGLMEIPGIFLKKLFDRDFSFIEFVSWFPLGLSKFFKMIFGKNKTAYITIGKGCSGKCSYCAIKYAIGKGVSIPAKKIIDDCTRRIKKGFNQLIFVSDDIGCYGDDIGSSLPELLSSVLENISTMEKQQVLNREVSININELHPKWLIKQKVDYVNLFKSKKVKSILCPIQSGNNRILSLMQREHTVHDLAKVFSMINNINPDISITTQIIIGFPSETESEFMETLEYLKQQKFKYVVIFPYHDKENTPSFKLQNKVSEKVIQRRVKTARKELKKAGIKTYLSCPD